MFATGGVKRKSLNGKSSFEFFTFKYGEKLAEVLGIEAVPANEVIQSPSRLKKSAIVSL